MSMSVIVLAYGDEEWLGECITSVLASEGEEPEVVVVDNGAAAASLATVSDLPGVRILTPGKNLGFAGGVNAGVRASSGDVIVLLNSDAYVATDTLALLGDRARQPEAGIVGALVLLADEPDTVNSAGNPLHILGLSWAGRMGDPASSVPPVIDDVASASGACLAISRALWDRLDGFWDPYFAYLEDMDLSWRTRQLGLPVRILGEARVWHHYEFSRTDIKAYLLERNRLVLLLTCHERRTLAALALPLVALEAAMLVLAIAQGWGRQKVRGWVWLARNLPAVVRRRAAIQAARRVPDSDLVDHLVDTFSAQQLGMPAAGQALEVVLKAYWQIARRIITRGGPAVAR